MLKKLGSIKFAIVLLVLLVAASIIGTLVPQGLTENQYRTKYGEIYNLMIKLQLIDVYHSYWYTALLAIFCINLVSCSILNLKPLINILRNKNYVSDSLELKNMAFYKEIPFSSKANQAKMDEASQKIKNAITRNFYRLKYSDESKRIYYFEKGRLGRLGPLITHASIILILLGGILVSRLGFSEYINVPIGTTMDVPHANFQIRADDFKAEFYPDSQTPKEYTSVLTIIEDGVQKLTKTIEVNHPLGYKGIRFYQSSYGASDSITVELSKKSKDNEKKDFIGAYTINPYHDFQVPNTQLKIKLAEYVPDFVINDSGGIDSRSNNPNNPAALIEIYDGNESKYKSWVFQKFPEFHATADSEYSVKFISTGYYTGLQVSRSPFLFIVWLGFLTMVIGMFLAFYMQYKRIWTKVSADKIEIGGSSYKNRTGFDKEDRQLSNLSK
jgi:cytochrome c biogenesis protein